MAEEDIGTEDEGFEPEHGLARTMEDPAQEFVTHLKVQALIAEKGKIRPYKISPPQ